MAAAAQCGPVLRGPGCAHSALMPARGCLGLLRLDSDRGELVHDKAVKMFESRRHCFTSFPLTWTNQRDGHGSLLRVAASFVHSPSNKSGLIPC